MPTQSSLKISDPVLRNFALDYGSQELVTMSGMGTGNTASFIFPMMPVTGKHGKYYTYTQNNKTQLGYGARKEGNYPKVEWGRSSDSYTMEDYGFSTDYDDREAEVEMAGIDLSEDAADILPQRTLRGYANEVITAATTSGNYTAGVTNTNTAATGFGGITGAWDTPSTDIIGMVTQMRRVVMLNTGGIAPDRIVMGHDVWTNGVMQNDAIIAGMQAQQKAAGNQDFDVVKAVCRTFFNLDGAVDTTIYDSANPKQTTTNAFMFPKSVLVFVSNARVQRVKAMRLGFTAFNRREFLRGYQWRVEPHTNWRAVSFERSVKLVSDEAGCLLTSVVS